MRAKHLILTCFFFFSITTCIYAKTFYVSGVNQITMRTGPGLGHKVVDMVSSGVKLEILEYGKEWSMVRNSTGKTGWVLTRFLTEEAPKSLLVERYKQENERLASKLSAVEETARTLEVQNKELTEIAQKYKQLKDASAGYLKLEIKHKALLEQSREQEERIQRLERSVKSEVKFALLSGAGVFIVGLIFGMSTRKKRRGSLLS
ncbi:TIGR04211 family SH3 domain-containing protein [Desulfobacter postgatei]|jgi:SH3 domain protein|uniref:TIGR04211 family SH3 domain-containing protein n=1 Tax=Desulfobacter postgatei TaxID=2293 RepID=UPI002A35CDEB|nr:TIGR04211 family SH3 domain-containing protein [Desulfobacter postgatei]MDX9962185.1 TIGR04211 family SH3 domain-containing protein [Desulfobacter postgatei]